MYCFFLLVYDLVFLLALENLLLAVISQVCNHHGHVVAEILIAVLLFLKLLAQCGDLLLIRGYFFFSTAFFFLWALGLREFSGYLVS